MMRLCLDHCDGDRDACTRGESGSAQRAALFAGPRTVRGAAARPSPLEILVARPPKHALEAWGAALSWPRERSPPARCVALLCCDSMSLLVVLSPPRLLLLPIKIRQLNEDTVHV